MDLKQLPDNPYVLLTPGPLSTTKSVKATMLRDWCTWDNDYNAIVQDIRARLVKLAHGGDEYTAVLMQGSGTFSVESTIGSALPREGGKLLVVANGHYGDRIGVIAERLAIPATVLQLGEMGRPTPADIEKALDADPAITHVAVVHCETTTGMLNPVEAIGKVVKERGKVYIVDAMSSFGGIPIDIKALGADFLISSANKCIQGVPGFGFVIARRSELEKCGGNARSLSLDLHHQWREMEYKNGKWRFTSPTHVVRAFAQAMNELDEEGGVEARHARYSANHDALVAGMRALGYECLLPDDFQSPIITSFMNPAAPAYEFKKFYDELKGHGWVVYPGKVTGADTFRIGNIGDVSPQDIAELLKAVAASMYWE
ncbi:2-aminoethylphosphonate--pyruvate transaminase [Pseudodesulfovibrio sp.]|uniref:2-aminoethylphosphonate--pyruvate transaminase n=1 Tax=Pseudodesulfovibrio sp. TaxID=2035812 RepID=UPI0026144DC3|nr:2-aminoethylphosphonate--pyruvate transaminase [Pseudodesulfovibrio sp.]MDD3313846.1 2-aminoethylphosphonate--pyruvate transaminase [Pseudodesulfovibrio sp.]